MGLSKISDWLALSEISVKYFKFMYPSAGTIV